MVHNYKCDKNICETFSSKIVKNNMNGISKILNIIILFFFEKRAIRVLKIYFPRILTKHVNTRFICYINNPIRFSHCYNVDWKYFKYFLANYQEWNQPNASLYAKCLKFKFSKYFLRCWFSVKLSSSENF